MQTKIFVLVLLALTACKSLEPPLPDVPSPSPAPVTPPPSGHRPEVAALWDEPQPVEGPKWTQHVFDKVEQYAPVLVEGPSDVTSFCPDYHTLTLNQKISFWAYFFSAVAKFESAFKPTTRFKETGLGTDSITGEPVYSEGLLQLSYQDVKSYPFCNEFDWSKDRLLSRTDPKKTIFDPYKNLTCGIRILNKIAAGKGRISFPSGHYWSVLMSSHKNSKVSAIQSLTKAIPFCR